MADIKIGTKVFNGVNAMEFPSAADPTLMKPFKAVDIISDMFVDTGLSVKVTLVAQEDGSAIAYCDTDLTALTDTIGKGQNTLVLFSDESLPSIGKNWCGIFMQVLSGKPYYAAPILWGYAFLSTRLSGFIWSPFGTNLYNSEWGTEAGKYSLFKVNASNFTSMNDNGVAFLERSYHVIATRYPTVQLSVSLGDTDFVQDEVIVNE